MVTINKKSALRIFLACQMGLVGCTSSQDDVLGPAPTTTQAVIEEAMSTNPSFQNKVEANEVMASREGLSRYHQSTGLAEWVPRSQYVQNERLVLYIYPKRDGLGNFIPGHAVEMPLYKEVHMVMPTELDYGY
jgi:hypothetical protein